MLSVDGQETGRGRVGAVAAELDDVGRPRPQTEDHGLAGRLAEHQPHARCHLASKAEEASVLAAGGRHRPLHQMHRIQEVDGDMTCHGYPPHLPIAFRSPGESMMLSPVCFPRLPAGKQ